MPWNNQNGGGGWKGGGGGPWGQGPQGGGSGGGQQPPDLDELLKRSQDKFKQVMPGGGGSLIWFIVIAGLLGVWIFQSVYTLKAEEEGVVSRLGKYNRTVGSGFHFIYWPLDTLEKVQFSTQNEVTFGNNVGDRLMLAGDLNLVEIKYKVYWRVKTSKDYTFNVTNQKALVQGVSESAMREIVGQTPVEDVRTNNRQDVQRKVRDLIQKTLDGYNAGILIRSVALEEAKPPQEVAAAFEEVQSAEQEKSKLIRQGETKRNRIVGQAKGEAAKIIAEAQGDAAKNIAEAEGEAQRFLSVYNEYAKAKDVTRKRIFFETMERVLSGSNKVIIEKGGSGVVPYLPLPEIQKRKQAKGGQ